MKNLRADVYSSWLSIKLLRRLAFSNSPSFPIKKILIDFFIGITSTWGALVLLKDATNDEIDLLSAVNEKWILIAGLIFFISIWRSRPKTSMKRRLRERDASIEIKVGNLFEQDGELVIPTNTHLNFSHGNRPVSKYSVEGQFIHRCFDGSTEKLDSLLFNTYPALFQTGDSTSVKHEQVIGTVLPVTTSDGCKVLFVTTSPLNSDGNAISHDENLGLSLAGLWDYLAKQGFTDHVVMPVMGTGFAGHKRTREETIRSIVRSFIASCSQKTFCGRLTIVIHPRDLDNFIDLESIFHFLDCTVEVAEFDAIPESLIGKPAVLRVKTLQAKASIKNDTYEVK